MPCKSWCFYHSRKDWGGQATFSYILREKTHIYTSMNSKEIEEKYYKQEVEEAGGDFPSTCYYLSTEKNPSSRFLFLL